MAAVMVREEKGRSLQVEKNEADEFCLMRYMSDTAARRPLSFQLIHDIHQNLGSLRSALCG